MLCTPAAVKVPMDTMAVASADANKISVCPVKGCGKVFDRRFNMKAHLRKHTGERPYKCTFPGCNIRYMWRSSLANHMRRHKTLTDMKAKDERTHSTSDVTETQSTDTKIEDNTECFSLTLVKLTPERTEEVVMTRPVQDSRQRLEEASK